MGPMESVDNNQRLTSTVITLSGFHGTTIAMLLSEKCSIISPNIGDTTFLVSSEP